MTMTLAFDVYGTLVDPMGMADMLRDEAGDQADAVAQLWREKQVLGHNELLAQFDGLVSVDDLKSFKPDPAVYSHARRATGAWDEPLCLVSSNAWDVIGARSAGLRAIWVQRDRRRVFEDWGVAPSAVITDLSELAQALTALPRPPAT